MLLLLDRSRPLSHRTQNKIPICKTSEQLKKTLISRANQNSQTSKTVENVGNSIRHGGITCRFLLNATMCKIRVCITCASKYSELFI